MISARYKNFFVLILLPLFFLPCFGCGPRLLALGVRNKTSGPIQLEVRRPAFSAAEYHSIESGSNAWVLHQSLKESLNCKAELADAVVIVKYPNGVSIAYDRSELTRIAKWDPMSCNWLMDITITPTVDPPVCPPPVVPTVTCPPPLQAAKESHPPQAVEPAPAPLAGSPSAQNS